LKDAVEILAITDRAGNLMKQIQSFELRLGLLLSLSAYGNLRPQGSV